MIYGDAAYVERSDALANAMNARSKFALLGAGYAQGETSHSRREGRGERGILLLLAQRREEGDETTNGHDMRKLWNFRMRITDHPRVSRSRI